MAELTQQIQGKTVGSLDELRVANALTKYEISFDYQVAIDGGRGYRGGQVCDFVVYIPDAWPLQVFGEYWHKGQLNSEERLKLARLAQIYGHEVIVFWTADTQTQEAANQAVRKHLL